MGTIKKNIPIKGMTCASCAANVEKTMRKLDGIKGASVNFATEKLSVEFNPGVISIQEMNEAIKKIGYEMDLADTDLTDTITYGTGSEVKTGGSAIGKADKICDSTCDLKAAAEDQHNYSITGRDIKNVRQKTEKEVELTRQRNRVIFAVSAAIIVFLIMMWEITAASGFVKIRYLIPHDIYSRILLIFSTIILFWIGQPFLRGILNFIRYRVANMDTLVGIATLTAYVYSAAVVLFPAIPEALNLPVEHYFDATIVVIGFIYLGKYLEARSKLRTGEAIEKLINLQAKTAVIEREGKQIEVPVEELVVGDIVVVKPGGRIPVDGVITEGFSSIDESMITGESIPVDKKTGDNVIGGTVNKWGLLKLRAAKIGSDTLLAQIIKMVEDAQGSRAPIQRLTDKISQVFVPVVLGIAVISIIIWIAVGSRFMPMNQAFKFGILSFVGVLVIACPCALGLATPTAIIVGVGKGAQNGILIKNAESLENLHRVDTLVIDKTGTITTGKPQVADIVISNKGIFNTDNDPILRAPGYKEKDSYNETAVLGILASLEKNSEHPLAKAVVEKALESRTGFVEIINFKNFEGKGVKGDFNGRTYYAGNIKWAEELNISYDKNIIEEFTVQGKTPVLFFTDNKLIAALAIADTLKEDSISVIKKLHKLGINTVMISGDNKNTVKYIGRQAGIDEVFAEVLPQDKANIIKELQKKGAKVAMAGDGINDAPALVQADVGIAMGTGTDIAIESADITLLKGDISKIPKAIILSRQTMRTIRQNLFWAFIYNIIGIPLAAGLFYPIWGIVLNPVFAGIAMAFSSVSVVINSLRLKFTKLQ